MVLLLLRDPIRELARGSIDEPSRLLVAAGALVEVEGVGLREHAGVPAITRTPVAWVISRRLVHQLLQPVYYLLPVLLAEFFQEAGDGAPLPKDHSLALLAAEVLLGVD